MDINETEIKRTLAKYMSNSGDGLGATWEELRKIQECSKTIKALIQDEVKERDKLITDKLITDIKEALQNKEGYIYEVVLIKIEQLVTKYEGRINDG